MIFDGIFVINKKMHNRDLVVEYGSFRLLNILLQIDALEVMGVEAGAVIAVPGEDLVVTGAKAFTDELAASPGLLTRLIARRETSASESYHFLM
jgi:hypothetical protein